MSNSQDALADGKIPKLRFSEFMGQPIHDLYLGDVTEEPSARNRGKLAAELVMGVRKDEGIVPMVERLVAADISRYKIVKSDWFAYNPMRLNIGSIARWVGDKDVLVSPDYVVFRCVERAKPTGILPSYLDHFRRTKQWNSFVNGSGDGGVRVRIYYRDLARLPLLLPAVSEQKKIAACLSSINDVAAAEIEKLEALREYKQSLLQQMLPPKGEAFPRLRFREFARDGVWNIKPFKRLFTIGSGKDYKHLSAGDIPVYGSGGLMTKVDDYIHDGESACIGRKGTIDNPVFLKGKFWTVDTLFFTHSFKGVLPYFVYLLFQNIDWLSHNEGGGVPSLSKRNIEEIEGAFPELDEQKTICDLFKLIDDRIELQKHKVEVLISHKNGLIQRLIPIAGESER